jgi:hypothetical protein
MTHAPKITHAVDVDGTPIVKVEMSNRPGWVAVVDLIDFEDLLLGGATLPWFVNRNSSGLEYVRFTFSCVAGRLASVAPRIMRPGKGKVVTYRNGNRLDLRRRNLEVTRGNAKGATLRAERLPLAA